MTTTVQTTTATESAHEKMMNSFNTLDEVRGKVTGIATEIKNGVASEIDEINKDRFLSGDGKRAEREAVRKKYGEKFLNDAREMRSLYDTSATLAEVNAEILLNKEPRTPSGQAVKTYERHLTDLDTALLLATNERDAFDLVDNFVSSREQYDAHQFKKVLPRYISQVLDAVPAAEKLEYKKKMRGVLDKLNEKAYTSEQVDALNVASQVKGEFGADIFRTNSTAYKAIEDAIGTEYARYANKPNMI